MKLCPFVRGLLLIGTVVAFGVLSAVLIVQLEASE